MSNNISIKKTLRCSDSNCNHYNGNILLAFSGDRIFVRCPNRSCRLLSRITVRIPGININFDNAAITQEVLPKDHHLTIEPATTVVVE